MQVCLYLPPATQDTRKTMGKLPPSAVSVELGEAGCQCSHLRLPGAHRCCSCLWGAPGLGDALCTALH